METVNRELSVQGIITEGVKLGLKNFFSLIGAYILWILTIWIPYINVGTTIGLISIVLSMSKGKVISPTEIFDSRYRRYMGEFFLLMSFVYIGVIFGLLFVVIPGIVIGLAWGQAIYLLLDKGIGPMEALKMSNKITYGKKWTIFFGILVLTIILLIFDAILTFVGAQISEALGAILGIVSTLIMLPVILGGYAHIYRVLVQRLDEQEADRPAV